MKEIYFKEDLDKLYLGIAKLEKAVASTLGPNGRTVIITDEYGNPYVTKDGVSVARKINFKDPVENVGAQLVKEVCELQVKQAGDGTTTAIVLANAFIQNLKEFNYDEVVKAFDEIIPKIIEELKKNSKQLKQEDIKYVASISANNDSHIGDTIQRAYNFSNIVKVEESSNFEDNLETRNGMLLNVPYISKNFKNTVKEYCEFENPNVLLLDGKLEDLKPFKSILEDVIQKDESLLIVCEYVSEKELRKLETHVLTGTIKLCIIKTPGFSSVRKDYLRDLSDFTGADIINIQPNKLYTTQCLGKLGSCKITKNDSLLIKHEDVNVDEIVDNLKELSKSSELTKYDLEVVNKRIENLTAKASIIRVGGQSTLEVKERKDRYDDAVLAVACALEEGIVAGGGVALLRARNHGLQRYKLLDSVEGKVYLSLLNPYYKIFGENLNINQNCFEKNIIDPLKVTRCALENAVSIAKTILSTNTIVIDERLWN